jgi:hypothetical protein
MELLAYWKWNNFLKDTSAGLDFHFNSSQPQLHNAIQPGERLWLVTGRPAIVGQGFVMVGCWRIVGKAINPPGYEYGRLRLLGDIDRGLYFDPSGPDMSAVLLSLKFATNKPIVSRQAIPHALQAIRGLAEDDIWRLEEWAACLGLHPKMREIRPEGVTGGAWSIDDAPSGVLRRQSTTQRIVRNTAMIVSVKCLHNYQCQVCGLRLETLDGPYAEGGHIIPLGGPHNGPDIPGNILCLCPNHHVLLDTGSIAIADDFRVTEEPNGTFIAYLRTATGHEVSKQSLRHHRNFHWGVED